MRRPKDTICHGEWGAPHRTPTRNAACLALAQRRALPLCPRDLWISLLTLGKGNSPPTSGSTVMSLLFCLLTHRKGNFTLQRLYHFSYRCIQEWPLDMGMGPHWWGQASTHYPITPLQTHSFEAHLGAPSRLPGCLSCPAPPNSSQFIALTSTPLPSASAPTTAASAYGALRGPHRSSHEPSQPSTAGVPGTFMGDADIPRALCQSPGW